ncbi:MAG: UvrD-helicase domain-containing protein [Spirochaetaceae bacterium]|nr:UvrD-helicase domain-containing protein [Spirochaetaceae bacterium]
MDLTKLNNEQFNAVTTIDGPLLIIAGAGSGKTGVITHRIAYMLKQGIAQSHILALTFTNKAANEMAERVKNLSKSKLSNLTVSTFHAFGVKVLKENCAKLGWRPNFTIYDSLDQIEVIKEAGLELNANFEREELKKIAQLFSAIKTEQCSLHQQEPFYQQLYAEYEDFLQLKNAFDFDDLIVKPIKLFTANPEVLAGYHKRYKYIMVDEFQDTSLMQYKLLQLLGYKSRNVCCVGDDDQSIYSWRGANYENILNFEKDFPERQEIKLERNYRSTGNILKAANNVIANNSNRKDKELWTEEQANEAALQLRFLEDEEEESEFIASTILTLKKTEQRKLADFGILVRTNSLMDIIEEALMHRNLAYSISGGSSFFERREIKDITAYLKLISNYSDDISLLRIINTPRRGVGKKGLEAIRNYAKGKNIALFYALKNMVYGEQSHFNEGTRADLAEFIELIQKYHDLMHGKQMAQFGRDLVEELNYWHYLLTDCSDKEAKWRYDNIMRFFDFFDNWLSNPDNLEPTLINYLNRITLNGRESTDDDGDKVSLMTIHAAKGLEFKVTFLAGVEENIIPHQRAIAEDAVNIEEERRLFYVALTRAREKLFILACHKRKNARESQNNKPSPFLTEIPSELIETSEEESELVAEELATSFFNKFK